jgi:hypothetical protein
MQIMVERVRANVAIKAFIRAVTFHVKHAINSITSFALSSRDSTSNCPIMFAHQALMPPFR